MHPVIRDNVRVAQCTCEYASRNNPQGCFTPIWCDEQGRTRDWQRRPFIRMSDEALEQLRLTMPSHTSNAQVRVEVLRDIEQELRIREASA